MRAAGMLLSVWAASALFGSFCLAFLLNTPTLIGPDEPYHFDRIIAAAHGNLVPTPGSLYVSKGGRGTERVFVVTQMRHGTASWAQYTPSLRADRPSLHDLGGNARSVNRDVSNYMTQHPPLYYALMGGVMWLIPHAEDMSADALVFWLRFCSILLLALPLPYLFGRAALSLFGPGVISRAAPFLTLLVPGLARGAATMNNDNLAILVGAAVVAMSVQVMRGDRTTRTASILAALCIIGSLTKGTELILLLIVPLAYGLQAFRLRRLPGRDALIALGVGAVLSAAWWVRNLILYGHLTPEELAWGSQYLRATGVPRVGTPVDYGQFWRVALHSIDIRFWGALGLHEPPQLPPAMLTVLWFALFAAFAVTIAKVRGKRLDVLLLWGVPALSLAAVIGQSLAAFAKYPTIAGIQGRYTYPAVFGLLLPFAVAAAVLLGRKARWCSAVVGLLGLLASGWALYTSVEYTWLVRGDRLVPSNWIDAFRSMAGFFPYPGVMSGLLVLVALGLAACGLVLTGLAVRRAPQAGQRAELDYQSA